MKPNRYTYNSRRVKSPSYVSGVWRRGAGLENRNDFWQIALPFFNPLFEIAGRCQTCELRQIIPKCARVALAVVVIGLAVRSFGLRTIRQLVTSSESFFFSAFVWERKCWSYNWSCLGGQKFCGLGECSIQQNGETPGFFVGTAESLPGWTGPVGGDCYSP